MELARLAPGSQTLLAAQTLGFHVPASGGAPHVVLSLARHSI